MQTIHVKSSCGLSMHADGCMLQGPSSSKASPAASSRQTTVPASQCGLPVTRDAVCGRLLGRSRIPAVGMTSQARLPASSIVNSRLPSTGPKVYARQVLQLGVCFATADRQTDSTGEHSTDNSTDSTQPYVQHNPVTLNLRSEISNLFRAAIATSCPDALHEPVITQCANPKFGDYQCNSAMPLFGQFKGTLGFKSPRDLGTAIAATLPASRMIQDVSVAGSGFVNCRIAPSQLARLVKNMLTGDLQQFAPSLRGLRCVVDFSSPNIAKAMHVGHLRSTIIGDTIARVLEFCGADVLRLNHVGDWGTPFGMLIQHMSEQPEGFAKVDDINELLRLYKESTARFKDTTQAEFADRARHMVTRIQSGDPEVLQIWQKMCATSRKAFESVYARLGVQLEERGESFYNPLLKPLVDELQEQGMTTVSDDAVCIFLENNKLPLIVQKSDGGFGYATTDLAAVKHRVQQEKADWVVYVTDVGQSLHFQMVFDAARKAGWLDGVDGRPTPRIEHVGFGLVLDEDGKRLRSSGPESTLLVELLDEAKARCKRTIRQRWQDSGMQVDEEELESASAAMGYGAVKYADLKNNRSTNYKFDAGFDAMLDLKGNTAVYLLYAHARIASVVRKAGMDVNALAATTHVSLTQSQEADLALHLARLPEALEDMLKEMAPNRLTDYLYTLSEKFNQFYVAPKCRVIEQGDNGIDAVNHSRLLLCEATARVMRQCFHLLGITPLYRI